MTLVGAPDPLPCNRSGISRRVLPRRYRDPVNAPTAAAADRTDFHSAIRHFVEQLVADHPGVFDGTFSYRIDAHLAEGSEPPAGYDADGRMVPFVFTTDPRDP